MCCLQPRLKQLSVLSSLKFHACIRNHCSLIESFLGVRKLENNWGHKNTLEAVLGTARGA